jgi:hypothetical protein
VSLFHNFWRHILELLINVEVTLVAHLHGKYRSLQSHNSRLAHFLSIVALQNKRQCDSSVGIATRLRAGLRGF